MAPWGATLHPGAHPTEWHMKKTLGLVAIAIALVASPARATNGMRMIGFGPVQNSMGGASVAAPLDGATAVSNPAGLADLAPRVDVAGQGFMPSVKYKADWSMGAPPVTASQSSDRPTDMLPTVAAVYKLQDRYTVGLAALGTAGMGVDYAQGASGLFGGTRTMTSYLDGRVAPAVAYKVNDQISVGFAANLMFAQMSYEAAAGLLLALDGQWINWSATNGKDQPKFTKNAPPAGQGWNMNWSDQFVVKLGAEYQVPALKALKVRAGYNYGKAPLDKDRGFENIAFPAIAEHHFTVGAGYDLGKLAVNAAFMYSPESTLKAAASMSLRCASCRSRSSVKRIFCERCSSASLSPNAVLIASGRSTSRTSTASTMTCFPSSARSTSS